MATATETALHPAPQAALRDKLCARLKDELDLGTVMQVPRVTKVTLNMGVGEAKTEAKALDSAIEELTRIAGQRAQVRRARRSIAGFKIREGMPIGARVTLRGDRMYDFLDRLISIALPRIRDFRGLNAGSFDGRGNYSLGIREQIIFPEIDYDDISSIRGLDVAVTTTARPTSRGSRCCAASGSRLPACRETDRKRSNRMAKKSLIAKAASHAAISGAEVLALQPLRPAARGLQEVRALPDLPAGARPRRRDPRHDQEW